MIGSNEFSKLPINTIAEVHFNEIDAKKQPKILLLFTVRKRLIKRFAMTEFYNSSNLVKSKTNLTDRYTTDR